jgi:hypothetical protein
LPSLPDLQRAFAGAVLGEVTAPVSNWIVSDHFPSTRRLQVYRNNVVTSLSDALAAVYPVVQRLVAPGFFAYAAHEYLHQHPSRSGNLHDFGDHFPQFLQDFEPASALAYLPDVARLEWAWHRVFHASECPPLSLEKLAAVPAENYERLRFKLHPARQLLASRYPVLRIWEANQDDYHGDLAVDLDQEAQQLLILRRELEVTIQPVSAGEHALLATLAANDTFANACEAALAVQEELDVPGCLRRHVLDGTLVDIEIRP